MSYIINDKKFDPLKSEELYHRGHYQNACRRDGSLRVYRSAKGTIWATLSWWPNEYGDMREQTAEGETAVKSLCASIGCVDAIEAAFGPMQEG